LHGFASFAPISDELGGVPNDFFLRSVARVDLLSISEDVSHLFLNFLPGNYYGNNHLAECFGSTNLKLNPLIV
jgi:hypothetical protein